MEDIGFRWVTLYLKWVNDLPCDGIVNSLRWREAWVCGEIFKPFAGVVFGTITLLSIGGTR